MTPMLSLFVPNKPIAFARARSRGAHRYMPEPQASYMAAVGTLARCEMAKAGYAPFEGPVEVIYRATFGWPKSVPERHRKQGAYKPSKSDLDNLVKVCADAINGIVYLDDAQIVRLTAEKIYGQPEGVTITVSQIAEG